MSIKIKTSNIFMQKKKMGGGFYSEQSINILNKDRFVSRIFPLPQAQIWLGN
jgi:hypothetical protein